jgi:uncharacterized membrane protein
VAKLPAALALGAALVAPGAGCVEHEPEVGRVGSPLPDSGETDGFASEVTWCEALAIIQRKCQRCHADPPQNDAPFPLVTYSDTQATHSNRPVHVRMHSAVETGFMPFVELNDTLNLDPPVEDLTAEEKATLLAWLEQGALPVGGVDCPATPGGG